MTVTARFTVFDNEDQVDVWNLYFNVMGMNYAGGDSAARRDSGTCWKRPGGILADLSAWEVPLPDTMVRYSVWTRAEIVLRTPDGPSRLPDSADFRAWSDPRYAKFYLVRGTDSLPALFEMPAGMEIHLVYTQNLIQSWSWATTMQVLLDFDAGNWAGFLDPKGAWTRRQDGMHRPYALFSPTENAAAWSDLAARLPASFVADSIQVR